MIKRVSVFLARGKVDHRIAARYQFFHQARVGHVTRYFLDTRDTDSVAMTQRTDLVAGLQQCFAQGGPQFPAGPGYQYTLDGAWHSDYLR